MDRIGPSVLRLMRSFSADSSAVVKYLLAFGITRFSEDLPAVFDSVHTSTWKAFVRSKVLKTGDMNQLLRICLEFVEYMASIKIDPFARIVNDPYTKAKLKPTGVYKNLTVAQLEDAATDIAQFVAKLKASARLSVYKRKSVVDGNSIVFTLIMETNSNRASFNDAIIAAKSILYKSLSIPPQLEDRFRSVGKKRVSVLDRYQDILASTSTSRWLFCLSDPRFSVHAIRVAGDKLAVRVVIGLPQSYERLSADSSRRKRLVLAEWSKFSNKM